MMIPIKNIVLIVSIISSSLTFTNSKTMFIPRLISTDEVIELGLTNYQFHHRKETIHQVAAFKPFYQKSNAFSTLARFFLPNNKTCILLREDGSGDVNPLWLDLISAPNTSYSSSLSLKPRRTSTGCVFTWYNNLNKIVEHLWLGINTAFIHTEHSLNLKESNLSSPGTLAGFENACDALNNPNWCAGKLSGKPLRHNGLDDIQLKIGYDLSDEIDQHISPYIVGTLPTGKKPKAHYLFEPLVGSPHGSLGLGLNMNFSLYNRLNIMMDAKYGYVFASHERRSFDLHNGDWSRYLLLVTQAEPLNSFPGINSFTLPVHVTPANTLQLWSALHYDHASWQCEVGYNFWLRGKEKVALKACSLNYSPVGILDMIHVCSAPVTTAHTATISQSVVGSNRVVSDSEFTPTTVKDLNVCSAVNQRTFSNTFYCSCGYQSPHAPVLLALNASYECAGNRYALDQYSLWATVELQF